MSGFLLKAGTTFVLTCKVEHDDGTLVDLTGFVFASQIRDSQGNQIAALSAVVPANTTGILNLSFAGSTATWAAGNYLCDVVFTSPTGLVTATETFAVTVIPGVTQIGNPTP